MRICTICGTYLDSGYCPNNCVLYNQDNTRYNYKCPECNGEFNQPACLNTTSTVPIYRCPFCGFKMEGM